MTSFERAMGLLKPAFVDQEEFATVQEIIGAGFRDEPDLDTIVGVVNRILSRPEFAAFLKPEWRDQPIVIPPPPLHVRVASGIKCRVRSEFAWFRRAARFVWAEARDCIDFATCLIMSK